MYAHNFSRFDSKLLVEAVPDKFSTSFVLKNDEQFMEVRINPPYQGKNACKEENRVYSLRFLDSLSHMSCSLDRWVQSLDGECFKFLDREMVKIDARYTTEVINLCKMKGVFCYEYVTSPQQLKEVSLPPKEAFYSHLRGTHITNAEYDHAQNLFTTAKCKNIGEYAQLYLVTDVLLLAVAFQQLRHVLYERYEIDPVYFITNPAFSMQAALKASGQEFDLMSDMDMARLF